MTWFRRSRIPTPTPARSLTWRGDDLVDWLAGGDGWRSANGSIMPGAAGAFRVAGDVVCDGVIADDSGRWAVAHQRAGTHGVLLHDGRVLRWLTRAEYHADAYDWPACFFRTSEGRLVLAHCPEYYARIEIDDVENGERLTASTDREDVDFFYSRLAVSPGGKRMLTAGWVWQPWDIVQWLELAPVFSDPTALDRWQTTSHAGHVGLAEESSAAWVNDEILVIGASGEPEDDETSQEAEAEAPGAPRLRTSGLAVFDASSGACVSAIELGYPPGIMMAAGFNHVVTFFQHPRLVSLETREVVHEWSDLDSGDVVSSITWGRARAPLALDAANARFALQTPTAIEIVALDATDLPRTALEAALKRR